MLRPQITFRRAGARLGFLVAVLLLWQLLAATDTIPSDALAPVTSIAAAMVRVVPTGEFWHSLTGTLFNWGAGTAIAFGIAVPAGLILGSSELLYQIFRIPIEFMRTIPSIALLPLALLLYGATSSMAILLIVLGALWPLLLQSMYGMRQLDPVMREVVASYRLRLRDRVLRVVLPEAAPFIATGVRIALTVGLLLSVGAEMLGGAPGLGRQIALDQQTSVIPDMYAYIVVVAALGTLLNLIMLAVERSVLSWHSSHRPAS
jgi:ABC-type nitrate/sulfonate/bicarbonate transport system permease component